MPDLLVEIGCEELPAAACGQAQAQLPGLLDAELARAGITAAERRVHVAPRRLAVIALELPGERPAERSEVRGPREDAPDQALAGFARKHGLDPARLERRDGFVWAVSEGSPTQLADLVPDVVRGLVEGIQFSKSMRYEGGRFSRPIRWLVVKLDDAVVPMRLAGLQSGDTTYGHRYEGGHTAVGTAATYLADLRAVRAMAEASERRAAIVAGLDAAGPWKDPGGKLDEVVHLVEWPVVLEGRFAAGYLELPERVVVTAMQSHQRYFPVRRVGAPLEPRFLFVANGGDPDIVRAGNEEVLVGRLDDAAFAHRRDLERGLEAMAAELDRVSFLEGSGSLADKAARLGPIAERLCDRNGLPQAVRAAAVRAAALCKADLVSGLVSEFADLEGYAGSIYARAAGEDEAVCAAIEEHHRPREAGGELPASEAGAVLALADKADTLAVAFGLGLEPTGSRDPFGLRRAAAGRGGHRACPRLPARPERAPGRARGRVRARPAGAVAPGGGADGRGGARGTRGGGRRARRRGRGRPGAARVCRPAARRRARRLRPLRTHRRRRGGRAGRRRAADRARRAGARAGAGLCAGDARRGGRPRAGRQPLLRGRARDGPRRGRAREPADPRRQCGRGPAPPR